MRLVRWERELGLVPGPVLMCECLGQFSRWGPACRKFWNTPSCPSHSHSRSRSPARYFHWVFKDGVMGVEGCSFWCRRARVDINSFLESTLPGLSSFLAQCHLFPPPPQFRSKYSQHPHGPHPFFFQLRKIQLAVLHLNRMLKVRPS